MEREEYNIPKGSMLTYNIEYMMKVNEKGEIGKVMLMTSILRTFNKMINLKQMIHYPFGFGSRDCPGKAFAIKSVQIVAGYLIMNYKIEFGDGEKERSSECRY